MPHLITPPTLGYLRDTNRVERLRVYCATVDCHHHSTIILAALIDRFGDDWPATDIDKHLVCSKCGNRQVMTHLDWPVHKPQA